MKKIFKSEFIETVKLHGTKVGFLDFGQIKLKKQEEMWEWMILLA